MAGVAADSPIRRAAAVRDRPSARTCRAAPRAVARAGTPLITTARLSADIYEAQEESRAQSGLGQPIDPDRRATPCQVHGGPAQRLLPVAGGQDLRLPPEPHAWTARSSIPVATKPQPSTRGTESDSFC